MNISTRDTAIEAGHGRCLFVVANGSRGKAYRKRLDVTGYDAVHAWDEPLARVKDAEQFEDRPGRRFDAGGVGQRSAMDGDRKDESPKEQAKRDLAQRIAEDLAAALRADTAERFAVVAPAPIARAVIDSLPAEHRHALAWEDHHDLTGLPLADLFERLDALRHGV